MDLLKLISGLEDLVVEIALWIILLPRTLWCAIVTPVKLARYFDSIEPIPPKDRDETYLSPVLFWLLLAPTSLIIWLTRQDQTTLALYGGQPKEQIGVAALMLLGLPLGFALASVWLKREVLSKRSLRRQFALQCYFNAPLAIAMVLSFSLRNRFGENVANVPFTIGSIWFLITEFRVARRDSAVGQSIGLVALGCSFAGLLFVLMALAITLALVLSGRLPGLR